MKVRKKPVVVDAVQFTGSNLSEIADFIGAPFDGRITTLEGVLIADQNDWIIKGVKGEFYPCKPDIFAQTYEPAE